MVSAMSDKTTYNLSWEQFHSATRKLAYDLREYWKQANVDPELHRVVAIARGGAPGAVMLSHLLDLPIIGTIHASSYTGKTSGECQVTQRPWITECKIQHAIFVDDILDTGNTLETLTRLYGPDVRFSTLVGKQSAMIKYYNRFWVTPPIVVPDTCWVTFPWEGKLTKLVDAF